MSKRNVFRGKLKGFALVPTESQAVVGYSLATSFSKITLHYHTEEGGVNKDTLTRDFYFTTHGFNNIATERGGTNLAGLVNKNEPFVLPTDERYVQSGSPVIPRLDLEKFYEFADTLDNIIVNSAELVISDVQSPDATPVITSFSLRPILNTQRLFADTSNVDALNGLYVYANPATTPPDPYIYVRGDLGTSDARALALYNSDRDRYSAYLTLFLQSMFIQRIQTRIFVTWGCIPTPRLHLLPLTEQSLTRTT
ncbi:MAG: DUF4270 domain-containing protein [Bacteroidia bacterium]|nr:DUF4270 domain-containing protein [Bacteroidia bacterium]